MAGELRYLVLPVLCLSWHQLLCLCSPGHLPWAPSIPLSPLATLWTESQRDIRAASAEGSPYVLVLVKVEEENAGLYLSIRLLQSSADEGQKPALPLALS